MSWHYWYVNDAGTPTEITGRVQVGWATNPGTDGLVTNAEEGSTGSSSVTIEDPLGDFSINGHRRFWVIEDEALDYDYDDFDGYIYEGYVATQTISRGPSEMTDAARIWRVDLVDINSLLERRIMTGADANRPAETDVARITWLLSTAEYAFITDATYFDTDGPVSMDAVDYRGQLGRQVFDDCAQQAEKNFYIFRTADGISLWYAPPGTADFASSAKISNLLSDVDSVTVHAPAQRTTMTRDPSRVYSKVYMAYANSYIVVARQSTAEAFAERDTYSSLGNVKTATAAKARANRQLTKIATQEIVISTAVNVTRAQTNAIVPGHRVQIKATHLPGFSDFLWCRVINRTVRELAPDVIELSLELSPDEPVPGEIGTPGGGPGATLYGILRRASGPYGGDRLAWDFEGDAPDDPGYPTQPTVGLLEPIVNATPTNSEFPLDGWAIIGDGTIDVTCFVTTLGVRLRTVTYTITLAILKNGIVQDTTVQTLTADAEGGFAFYGSSMTVRITGLDVASGDLITATLSCTPERMPYFRTPWGTGQAGERLEITGGTLA